MIGFKGGLDPKFKKRFVSRLGQFQAEAGILKPEQTHYMARSIYTKTGKRKKKKAAFTSVDGMKARRKTSKPAGTMYSVAEIQSKILRINFITAPFSGGKTSQLTKVRKAWIALIKAQRPMSKRKQLEDALVNAIREPIRKRRYGPNTSITIREKGFNRRLFDTGQLWKSIKAKVSKMKAKASV